MWWLKKTGLVSTLILIIKSFAWTVTIVPVTVTVTVTVMVKVTVVEWGLTSDKAL